jgi:nicotinamidase-related amidase
MMKLMQNSWDAYALLLIDVQYDFWDEDVKTGFPNFPENTRNLLELCRREQIEVIHVRAVFSADGSDWMAPYKVKGWIPCIQGTDGAKPLPWAEAQGHEKVFVKKTFDAFCLPELDAYLKAKGKGFLLTAGLVTSICVLLTTASAAQKGYLVNMVADCCGDEPLAHTHALERYQRIFMSTAGHQGILAMKPAWDRHLQSVKNLTKP